MHPRPMQEHVGKQVRNLTARIGRADEPFTHREARSDGERTGQLSGNEPEVADGLGQWKFGASPLHD